ncbi:MAG: 6-bladed beta-propeller [Gemmatimonadetes bacterium]|nr:6-bladed beta-propeller [Candidatus Palauibacter rhopaloidicola]
MTHRVSSLTAVSAVFFGCAPAGDSSQTAVVRDSAGVMVAENPPGAAGHEWALEQPAVLEIGRGEGQGPGSDLFGAIAHAIRLSNGHIAVADRHAQEVRVFDDAGGHVLTFGRPGEGPGEFTTLWSIAELGGDTIAAIDPLGGRVSLFSSAGVFGRSFPIPRLPGASAPNVVGWLADGTLLIESLTRSPSRDMRAQSTHFLYAVDRSGEILETLGELPGSPLGRNGLPLGFASRAEFAAGGNLAWVGQSGRFELVAHDRTGAVRRIVRLDRAPPAVTQPEIDEAQAAVERSLQGASGPAVERILATEYASHHPVHGTILADKAGNLWVERYRSHLLADPGPQEWDIFDGEGRLVGHLATPSDFEITDIGADFVLGFHTDELGVQTVRMYRLVRE